MYCKAGTIGVLAILLAGCEYAGDWGSSDRFKEDFHFVRDLKPGGRLTIDNANGSIEILGWEKDSVDVAGTKYAADEQVLEAIQIDVAGSPDSVRIRTVPPSGVRSRYGARYVIRVPHRVELDRIDSSNGSVRVEALEGSARLKTSNGALTILRLKGPLEATTSNGSIEVTDQTGAAVLRTSNGRIRADGIRGALQARTSNGGITARLSDPEPQRPITLESSNGSVDLTVGELRSNDVRITTSNSSIKLRVPSGVNANLRAHTSNSSVQSDFDVDARSGKRSKSHVEGAIGAGGPVLDLSTSNGSIRIEKL